MIKMSVKSNLKFPSMDFTEALKYVAERIVVPEISGHIQTGTDIQGNKYGPLAASTIRMKGHANPLIGKERRLFSSSTYHQTSRKKNEVLIRIKAIRADIGRFLQIEGVKSKRYGTRKFNFFGVNQIMETKAVNFMKRKIAEKIANG